ncbi:hypothetical protein [Streptomyces sp. Je 1-332]|uniref:hypothetical protein n=1 Tax=Streptomyces sp. Je 1-332 TaxID=3231270 RepID=UPI00345951B0
MPAESSRSAGQIDRQGPVTGYRITLPDQWAQVPLRQGTEEAIRRILDDAYARVPADAPPDKIGPYKRELERHFREAVAQAVKSKALDLYLPVRPLGEFSIGASILVSESLLALAVRRGSPRDELAEVLVEWFDALMANFRWRRG